MSDKITYVLDLDEKNALKKIDKIEKQISKSGKGASDNFSSGFNSGLSKTFSSLTKFKIGILGAAAAITATIATIRSLGAYAIEQEKAVNTLNTALKVSGDYTQDASVEMQRFASSLQDVTTFGDEAILSQIGFAKAMGATNDQAKDIVRAATDMAVALNIDLNSAVRNISKTLGGYAGELGEVIPELKNLTQEQLRAGEGIALLADKYRGFAAGELNIMDGSLKQLNNTFGDFLESLGNVITKSDVARGIISGLNETLKDATNSITTPELKLAEELELAEIALDRLNEKIRIREKEGFLANFRDRGDDLGDIGNLEELNKQKNDIISIMENLKFEIAQQNAEIEANAIIAKKDEAAKLKALEVQKNKDLLAELGKFGVITIDDINTRENLALATLERARQRELISLQEFEIQKQSISKAFAGQRAKIVDQEVAEIVNEFKIAEQEAAAESASFMASRMASFQNMANIVNNGISASIQSIGASFATGENFFDAFLGTVLNALGDLLIAFGTSAQVLGVTATAMKASIIGLIGGPSILAGIASIAAGGALKAYASGLGASTSGIDGSGTTATGGVTESTTESSIDLAEVEQEEATPTLTVNIQGNYLDTEENGQYLVNAINSAISNSNVKITKRAFA